MSESGGQEEKLYEPSEVRDRADNYGPVSGIAGSNRFYRGKSIPNSHVSRLYVSCKTPKRVLALVQSSYSGNYVVDLELRGRSLKVVHDCPDFRKRGGTCKHLVKVLLVVPSRLCNAACKSWHYAKRISGRAEAEASRKELERKAALSLVAKGKVKEAVEALARAGEFAAAVETAADNGQWTLALRLTSELESALEGLEPDRLVDGALEQMASEAPAARFEALDALVELVKGAGGGSGVGAESVVSRPGFLSLPPLEKLYLRARLGLSGTTVEGQEAEAEVEAGAAREGLLESLMDCLAQLRPAEDVEALVRASRVVGVDLPPDVKREADGYGKYLEDLERSGLRRKFAFLKALLLRQLGRGFVRRMYLDRPRKSYGFYFGGATSGDPPVVKFALEKCGFPKSHPDYVTTDELVKNYPFLHEFFGVNTMAGEARRYWKRAHDRVACTFREDGGEPELEFARTDWQVFLGGATEGGNNGGGRSGGGESRVVLVEWDLASAPVLGSALVAYEEGAIIPLQGEPLTEDLEPFDLALCDARPASIKRGGAVKELKPLRKVGVADAIRGVYAGVPFVSSALPLDVVRRLSKGETSLHGAWDEARSRLRQRFVPKGPEFLAALEEFLDEQVRGDLEKFYDEAKEDPDRFVEVAAELVGLRDYAAMFEDDPLEPFVEATQLEFESLSELGWALHEEAGRVLRRRVAADPVEPKGVVLENVAKFPSFAGLARSVVRARLRQLGRATVKALAGGKYDVTELEGTYYGRLLLRETLGVELVGRPVTREEWEDLLANIKYLGLERVVRVVP